MIGYVMVGTNSLDDAATFFDELLSMIGATRFLESERFVAWSVGQDKPSFAVTLPYDGNEASVGNGSMCAIALENAEQVDAFHARALELGGSDEGAPGPRNDMLYCGYFRDLDGNKFNAFCPLQKA